jgi:hypothetical protein
MPGAYFAVVIKLARHKPPSHGLLIVQTVEEAFITAGAGTRNEANTGLDAAGVGAIREAARGGAYAGVRRRRRYRRHAELSFLIRA